MSAGMLVEVVDPPPFTSVAVQAAMGTMVAHVEFALYPNVIAATTLELPCPETQ